MSRDAGVSRQAIGGYHLHRQIARGGMARIHIARSLDGCQRVVAAKRLDPELANDEEFVAMFLDEARVASKIRHRNVVPVLDVVTIDGELIMVQELVHGAPLNRVFTRAKEQRARMPIAIAVSIAAQTLAGLHAAHEAVDETGAPLDVVHRDVSPQNIMIALDGTVRLLDFGVAKTAAAAHENGMFKGKLAYASPEQLRGNATKQSDIYALAVVLWELCTGKRLHVGESDTQVLASVMLTRPSRLTDALAEQRADGMIDDATWREIQAIEPVLDKALAQDLADRYATAEEMAHVLCAAVAPAPLDQVARWMRSVAQDLIDQLDQVIADEAQSWRNWRDTGTWEVITQLQRTQPRSSTSLPTRAARPRLQAAYASVREARRRWPLLTFAVDAIAVASSVLLLAIGSARSHQTAAATLPTAPSPGVGAPSTTPAPARAAAAQPPATTRPTKHVPATRPPAAKRARGVVAAKPDCRIPFVYEGTKKVFKPRCI